MTSTGSPVAAASTLTLADYAAEARERLDPGVGDFLEGGAGQERTLAADPAAFDRG